jgi:hypothetical protein
MDYRQGITSALRELTVMKWFFGGTVDELAVRTKISKRTNYRYFYENTCSSKPVTGRFMGVLHSGGKIVQPRGTLPRGCTGFRLLGRLRPVAREDPR